jgi:hypothetical protein
LLNQTVNMKLRSLLSVTLGLLSISLSAQSNYWSQQYGSRSSLMGGCVVGGVRDNSALYYNPAGIAYIDSAHLNVSANAYGMDYMQLKNGAGTNLDLNSLKILVYPQFISGLVKFKVAPKFKMAYGLLTRYRGEIKMHADNTLPDYNVIPNSTNGQYYYGTFDYELSSISQWGGLAMGYKFTPFFAMGFTTFVTYSHYDGFRKTFATADVFHPDPDSSYMARFGSYEYNTVDHFGLLWKVGFQFNWTRFKLGVTITTPNVSLFGFTRIGRTLEFANQDKFINDSIPIGRYPTWLASDDKTGLKTNLKSPLSLAIGLEWDFPKTNTKITGTAEWFAAVPEYVIAQSDAPVYIRPTDQYMNATVPQSFMQLTAKYSPVVNIGFGLDQRIGKKTNLYLGVRTDFNNGYQIDSNRTILTNKLNQAYNHYLHFSGGVTYRKGSSDITFGLNYGIGTTVFKRQLINLTEPQISASGTSYLALQGFQNETISANVHSISLIIGYTYYIKR